MAAETDDWREHSRELASQPREPDDEDQSADPDPPDSDGYEPI